MTKIRNLKTFFILRHKSYLKGNLDYLLYIIRGELLMDIDKIYENLLEQPVGAQYFKSDLHIHFEPKNFNKQELIDYCQKLFKVLKKNQVNLIALTVHREQDLELLFKGIEILTELSKENNYKIYIFPAIEVKDSNNAHVAIIFDHYMLKEGIISFLGSIERIRDKANNNMDHCDSIKKNIIGDRINIKDKMSEYKAIAFFPHPLSEGGIAKTVSGESLIRFVQDPLTYLWNLGIPSSKNLESDSKINNCPKTFTSTPIRYKTDKNFKKIARIKVSDAHNSEELDKIYSVCPSCPLYKYCNVGYTYLKLSIPTINALKQLEYDSKTRIRFDIQEIYNYPQLLGMYIKSNFFQEIYFKFNPELNVLIGGRGTGKSLVIDFIRFALNSIPSYDLGYYEIFSNKIKEQLGHEGKVIFFYKINREQIYAIERVLLLFENSEDIDWDKNVKATFYEKNKNDPFLELSFKKEYKIVIEALSQTEIPKIHKKTKSLWEIFDAFFKEFPEKFEREKKVEKLDSLKGIVLKQYETFDNLEKTHDELEIKKLNKSKMNEYLEKMEKLDIKKYQKILEINEKISKFKKSVINWVNVLEFNLRFPPEEEPFLEVDDKLKKELNSILKMYNKVKDNLNKLEIQFSELLKSNKERFEKEYNNLLELWKNYYRERYDEYKKILKDHDIDYIEKVQKEIIELDFQIKSLKVELKNLPILIKEIEENEKLVVKLADEIYQLTRCIEKKRREMIKEIENRLKELNIDIKIRPKKVRKNDQYNQLLKKIHPTKLEDILEKIQKDFLPHQLGFCILKEEIQNYSKNFEKKKRAVFEKLNNLIKNSNHPKIYDENLIELFKIYIEKQPIISFKRENLNQYVPLIKLSIGERCAVLLYVMLLVKNKPLLIDQADSELDQESVQKFSEYLLAIKNSRQIIVATHNPNIPTLGDVDLLYHLDTIPSEDREIGQILIQGGFEDCIDSILTLEGGKKAIKRRFKKYIKKFY